jgi:hypothetical protein
MHESWMASQAANAVDEPQLDAPYVPLQSEEERLAAMMDYEEIMGGRVDENSDDAEASDHESLTSISSRGSKRMISMGNSSSSSSSSSSNNSNRTSTSRFSENSCSSSSMLNRDRREFHSQPRPHVAFGSEHFIINMNDSFDDE